MKNRERIEYIDMAKGFAILMVIVGHVSTIPTPLKSVIYSFHMPLFFFLNGFFFRQGNVAETIRRMIPTIIIPYFVVGGVTCIINIIESLINQSSLDYTNLLSLFGVCWKFNGDMVSIGAIWFLIVLFWSRVFLQIAMKYQKGIAALIILSTISMLATKAFHIVIPFGIQQALPCSLFVYAGFLCNQHKLFNVTMSKALVITLLFATLPFWAKFSVATRANSYSSGVLSIIASCFIVWMLVMVLKFLSETSIGWLKKSRITGMLSWCGKLSLVILAVHDVEARHFVYQDSNFIIEILVRIAVILALTWVCTKIPTTRGLFNIK